MNYIDPSVKLIDSSISNLGYYLWLKSRQWVIKDTSGNKFMTDLELSKDWMNEVPKEFYVGTELVSIKDYESRVTKMDLQFNELEYYVYEIQGSCLFRDFLFTISGISEWAQSNRFLFSILDDINNENNYPVSSEYKGIPEWESQFRKYMDKIKSDPIVDHNRLEMPYSISSTFWIGLSRKTLLDMLSFMKYYVPALYKIYGRKFNIPSKLIPKEPSAKLTQYLMPEKSFSNFNEGLIEDNGTTILNINMGLILYSQFIRQTDVYCSGFMNLIKHSNGDKFMHTVFKGGTVFPIHAVGSTVKFMSTVRTRMCAFAMSSGDGPCSWNNVISKFIPEDLVNKPWDAVKYLPCQFSKGKLLKCKFEEDMKFRNEGLEKSNCPCPIFSGSMEDAKVKKLRDNNKIGDLFYNITSSLNSGSLEYTWSTVEWTSRLTIGSDVEFDKFKITEILDNYRDLWYKYNKKPEVLEIMPEMKWVTSLAETKLFPYYDVTSGMKGLAIDAIRKELTSLGATKYYINFGGDIYIHNCSAEVKIDDTKFKFNLPVGSYIIMTSGNNKRRGNHIIGCDEGDTVTLMSELNDKINTDYHFAFVYDIYTTQMASNRFIYNIRMYLERFAKYITKLKFSDGKLTSPTYCASPFFNEEQIKVRDNMISEIVNPFRPDLTESSLKYESDKSTWTEEEKLNSVKSVVDENIYGIRKSSYLIFPSKTTDLGTLFEVGLALSQCKTIIKYNEDTKDYTIVPHDLSTYDINFDLKDKFLFDCSKKEDAIAIGFISTRVRPDSIYYQLKGCKDNIMLSVNYHHVEINENEEFIEYERDSEAHDE